MSPSSSSPPPSRNDFIISRLDISSSSSLAFMSSARCSMVSNTEFRSSRLSLRASISARNGRDCSQKIRYSLHSMQTRIPCKSFSASRRSSSVMGTVALLLLPWLPGCCGGGSWWSFGLISSFIILYACQTPLYVLYLPMDLSIFEHTVLYDPGLSTNLVYVVCFYCRPRKIT